MIDFVFIIFLNIYTTQHTSCIYAQFDMKFFVGRQKVCERLIVSSNWNSWTDAKWNMNYEKFLIDSNVWLFYSYADQF